SRQSNETSLRSLAEPISKHRHCGAIPGAGTTDGTASQPHIPNQRGKPRKAMKADEVKSASTAEEDSVVTEVHIVAPPERVFKALTDQGELVRWFTDKNCPFHQGEMDDRLGGRYR